MSQDLCTRITSIEAWWYFITNVCGSWNEVKRKKRRIKNRSLIQQYFEEIGTRDAFAFYLWMHLMSKMAFIQKQTHTHKPTKLMALRSGCPMKKKIKFFFYWTTTSRQMRKKNVFDKAICHWGLSNIFVVFFSLNRCSRQYSNTC